MQLTWFEEVGWVGGGVGGQGKCAYNCLFLLLLFCSKVDGPLTVHLIVQKQATKR